MSEYKAVACAVAMVVALAATIGLFAGSIGW